MKDGDTIVAIATPAGAGGIGIVRLSGQESLDRAIKTIRHKGETVLINDFPVRSPVYGDIVDPDSGSTLDQGLVTWFKAPHSYTGEDVVEISCHGSLPILKRLVEIFVEMGVRPADPGEFTYRAVISGRIDLTQAEAVNRLIRAETLIQAEQAVCQLDGAIREKVNDIESKLLDAIAHMEAEVDFAEEGESFVNRIQAAVELDHLEKKLNDLVSDFGVANMLRDGATVVLAGRSNAGKSTLFNALLRKERAIVDSMPGTTRDYIAERIDLDGVPVTIVDTAGLREGGEVVEREGMRRTERMIEEADIVLLVTVAGEKLNSEERAILEKLDDNSSRCILLRNKIDIQSEEIDTAEALPISALTGEGIGAVVERLREKLGIDRISIEKSMITEARQQQLFRNVADSVGRARLAFGNEEYDEVVLEELNSAMRSLAEITGKNSTEEVLSRIFSSFCIGK